MCSNKILSNCKLQHQRSNTGTGIAQESSYRGIAEVYEWNGDAWILKGSTLQGLEANDHFGQYCSLSSDGTTFIVSAPHASVGGTQLVGYAQVYRWDGFDWAQIGSNIAGAAYYDLLGRTKGLAISSNGQIVMTGTQFYDNKAGRVRIFQYVNNDWVQVGDEIRGTYCSSAVTFECYVRALRSSVFEGHIYIPHSYQKKSTETTRTYS